MRKSIKLGVATGIITFILCGTTIAGTWQQDQTGWYWEEENGAFPAASWKWLDGNRDGIAECYYFNDQGYLVTGTTAPDGYQVDTEGRWIENDVIKTRTDGESTAGPIQVYEEAYARMNSLNSYTAKVQFGIFPPDVSASTLGIDIKVKNNNTTDIKFLINAVANYDDVNLLTELFYADGYCYWKQHCEGEESETEKEKERLLYEEAMEELADFAVGMVLEPQYLLDFQLISQADGNQRYMFYTTPENIQGSSVISDSYLDGSHMEALSGTVVINSAGYLVESDLTMKVSKDGEIYDIKMLVQFTDPGEPVDFSLPSVEGFAGI